MTSEHPPLERLERLPSPSDWTFDLIETYHTEIAKTARGFGLDVYPNQLEVITAEQMMDCLLYTSPSPRDGLLSRMPSSA